MNNDNTQLTQTSLTESEIKTLLEKNPNWEPEPNTPQEIMEIFYKVRSELRAKISKLEEHFFTEHDDEKLEHSYDLKDDSYTSLDDEY